VGIREIVSASATPQRTVFIVYPPADRSRVFAILSESRANRCAIATISAMAINHRKTGSA
jgi:hypothetical protein